MAWKQGIIAAQDMPLPEFLTELARYRPGRLVCHKEVAHKVTATYPTVDTNRVREMLADTLPRQPEPPHPLLGDAAPSRLADR